MTDELLADLIEVMPHQDRIALLEACGIAVIGIATARAIERLCGLHEAGLPVDHDELSSVLYAITVAESFARRA